MTNDAAERLPFGTPAEKLHDQLAHSLNRGVRIGIINDTLAAEYEMGWKHGAADQEPRTRRATVERIRADILVSLYGDNHEPGPMPPYLAAILAAGAER